MKLIDFLKDGGQIFDSLATYPEWLTSDMKTAVQGQLVDYALRRIQPRVQLLADQLEMDLDEVVQMLVKNRIARNDYKYATLLATESFDYNPIENYNMIESGTDGHTKGQQVNSDLHGHTLTRTHSDTDTLTLNTSDARTSSASISGTSGSTEGSRTDSSSKSVYGYNSSEAVPSESDQNVKGQQVNSGSSSSQSSGSDTLLRTGTEANAHTGTITDANSGTDTHTEGQRIDSATHSLTRSGNIGTVTAQSMIIQEREIANFSFLKILTEDLVNSFCLGVM